jgi:hypothetical protein
MNRLQKFVEQGDFGERAGRNAYAFNVSILPEPRKGLDWRPVGGFSPANEVLGNGGLRQVFEEAIKRGYAVVVPD